MLPLPISDCLKKFNCSTLHPQQNYFTNVHGNCKFQNKSNKQLSKEHKYMLTNYRNKKEADNNRITKNPLGILPSLQCLKSQNILGQIIKQTDNGF